MTWSPANRQDFDHFPLYYDQMEYRNRKVWCFSIGLGGEGFSRTMSTCRYIAPKSCVTYVVSYKHRLSPIFWNGLYSSWADSRIIVTFSMESVQNRENFIHRLFTGVNVLGARFKCLETILETICYRYYEPVVRQAPNISEDRYNRNRSVACIENHCFYIRFPIEI